MLPGRTKRIPRLGRLDFELAVDFLAHPEKYAKLGPRERTPTLSDQLAKLADAKIIWPKDGLYSRFTEIRAFCRKPLDGTEPSFELVLNGQRHTITFDRYYNLVTLEEISEHTELPPPEWAEPEWLVEPPTAPKKKKPKACGPTMVIHPTHKDGFPDRIMPFPKPLGRVGSRFGTRSANE